MFGCTWAEFQKAIPLYYDMSNATDVLMMSVSLQSDAQELIELGHKEQARQYLNKSKRLLIELRQAMEERDAQRR